MNNHAKPKMTRKEKKAAAKAKKMEQVVDQEEEIAVEEKLLNNEEASTENAVVSLDQKEEDLASLLDNHMFVPKAAEEETITDYGFCLLDDAPKKEVINKEELDVSAMKEKIRQEVLAELENDIRQVEKQKLEAVIGR